MPHLHSLRVRYGETDQMGVVHHANYLAYLEEARTVYMSAAGCPYGELERQGIGLPVRRIDLRYRGSARFEDELVVETRVLGLRAASLRFGYRVRRGSPPGDVPGPVITEGEVELACVGLDSDPRRPRLLPEDLRQRLEALLEPEG